MAAAGGDPPSLIGRVLAAIGGIVGRVGTYTGAVRAGVTAELERSAAPDFVSSLVAAKRLPSIAELKYRPTPSQRNIRGVMGNAAASEDEAAGRDRMVAAYNLAVTVAELKRWTGYEGVTQADYMRTDRKAQTLGAIGRLEENSFVYTQRFLRDFYLYIFTTTRAQNSRRDVARGGIVRASSTVSAPGYPDLKLFSVDDMLTLQALYNDIEDTVTIGGVDEPTIKPQISAVLGEVAVSGTEILIPVDRYDAAEALAQQLGGYRDRIYLSLARRTAAMAGVGGAGAGAGAGAAAANGNAVNLLLLPPRAPNISGRSGKGAVEPQSSVFPKALEALTEEPNIVGPAVRSGAGLAGMVARQAAITAEKAASSAANSIKQKAITAALRMQPRPREIVPSVQNTTEAAGALLALGAGSAPTGGVKRSRGEMSTPSTLPATKANMNSNSDQEGGARRRHKRRTHKRHAHRVKASRSRSRSRISRRRR